MPRPRNLQSLDGLPNSQAQRPAPHALDGHEDAEDLADIMIDSLLAAMAKLQGHDMPPILIDEVPEAFKPVPGRCLWVWDTVIKAAPDNIDTAPLLNLALRPSHQLPERLQAVTPRFARQVTCMRGSEMVASMKWLAEQGLLPNGPDQSDYHKFLSIQGYGPELDLELDLADLHTLDPKRFTPPRNSRRSPIQQWALKASPINRTLMQAVVDHPPFEVDLGHHLHTLYLNAVEFLTERSQDADKAADPELIEFIRTRDLRPFEEEVVRHYLTGKWETYRMASNHLPARQRVVWALLRAMVQVRYNHAYHRCQSAQAVLGTALLSGISPASFIKAAIHQLGRTSHTYISSPQLLEMTDWIRRLPEPRSTQAKVHRQDLVDELGELHEDYIKVQDDLNASLVGDVWQAMRSNGIPAWGLYGALGDPEE